MSKKNPYSKRERELNELAKSYELSTDRGEEIFMDADDLADLADWYFNNHQEQEAFDVLDKGLQIHADNTALLTEKANLLIEKGYVDEASAIADSLTDEQDDEATILRAKLLILQGNPEAAKEMLEEEREEIDFVGVAYMYLETGMPEEALQWLQMGKMENEEDDEPYLAALGDCYQSLKRYQDSINIVNKLIDLDPYSAHYWYGLALCHYHLEQYEQALEAADFSIVCDEEFGNSYSLRGDVYLCLGNREKAKEDYQTAVKLKALSPDFLRVFEVEDLMNAGKWEEAAWRLTPEVNDKSKGAKYRSEAMVQYAFCLLSMQEDHDAEDWLKKAVKLDPENFSAYILLGRLKMQNGDENAAVRYWKIALHLEPYDTTWEQIATHCLALMRLDYVEICYEKVKQIRPEDKYVDMMLAIINLVIGDDEKFQKYNHLCKYPLSDQKVQEYKAMLANADDEQLSETLYGIFKENSEKFL